MTVRSLGASGDGVGSSKVRLTGYVNRTHSLELDLAGIRDEDQARALGAQYLRPSAVRVSIEVPAETTPTIEQCRTELEAACEIASGHVAFAEDECDGEPPGEAGGEPQPTGLAALAGKVTFADFKAIKTPLEEAADDLDTACANVARTVKEIADEARPGMHGSKVVCLPVDAWARVTEALGEWTKASETYLRVDAAAHGHG